VNFLDPDLFSNSSRETILGKICEMTFINTLAFPNGFDYRIFITNQKDSMAIFPLHSLLCKFDQDWSSNPREIANCAAI